METIWLLTAILAILLIVYFMRKNVHKKGYWESRGVYQPEQKISGLLHVVYPTKSIIDTVVEIYKKCDCKKYYGYMIFKKPVLVICDPEIINLVLIKDFTHFQDRNMPLNEETDLLNSGLPNLTGDKWRILRHKITPTFTTGKMKMMVEEMKQCSDELVQFIKQKKGNSFEARDLLFKFIINVIGRVAFGIKVDALNEEKEKDNEFLNMSAGFFKPSISLQIKLVLSLVAPKLKDLFGLKFIDTKVNEFFPKFVQDLINYRKEHNERRNDFLQLMIDQKRKELALANSIDNHNVDKDSTVLKDNDLLKDVEEPEDMELLKHLKDLKFDKNSRVFSDSVITAQAFTFISGGSDTTSMVLGFALHYLAINQDVQRKLQQEIDNVLLNHEVNYDTIKKMKYLEQVLYEVLRLYTPGTMISRVCVQDYKIPGTDTVIEKGTIVQVPVAGIHRDPQYFPNPEEFNPDRFENLDTIPKNVFFPFGGGPRICIALRLAMLEMKICIATLLKSLTVIHSEKTALPLVLNARSITLHVKGGLWVKFQERNKQM